MRTLLLACTLLNLCACASLSNSDPLVIDVAGVEPLQSEGLELRLLVTIRIQNPNDSPVEYDGASLDFDINDRRLASGVSDETGTVPRYGESVLTMPVTISAFNVARQLLGYMNSPDNNEVSYRIRGKLDGGGFRARRFTDEGAFELRLPAQAL